MLPAEPSLLQIMVEASKYAWLYLAISRLFMKPMAFKTATACLVEASACSYSSTVSVGSCRGADKCNHHKPFQNASKMVAIA